MAPSSKVGPTMHSKGNSRQHLHGVCSTCSQSTCPVVLDCDHEWQWFFPRPQPGCPFILRLHVSNTGLMNPQPLKDAFDELCKGDTDVPDCVESWWQLMITRFLQRWRRTLHLSAFKICLEQICSLMLRFRVSGNNVF